MKTSHVGIVRMLPEIACSPYHRLFPVLKKVPLDKNPNGGHLGFRTLHIQLPEDDLDIIMLSNSGYHNEGRDDISEIIYRHVYGESVRDAAMEMDKGYI